VCKEKRSVGGGVGLKLFSTNTDSIKTAREYHARKLIDYIELMVLPGTYRGTMRSWQGLEVPFIIHAPHGTYGFNLSDPDKRRHNAKVFDESRNFADRLDAEFIIVHPGLMGEAEETARQIRKIDESRIIIENKPFISLRQTKCVGWSPEEIRFIMRETGIGFCLDIVHAVKAAYACGQDHNSFLNRFLALKPRVVHICDCKVKGCFDEHLNLGQGELDLCGIVGRSLKFSPKVKFTLEVPERSYKKLNSYRKDRLILKDCFNKGSR